DADQRDLLPDGDSGTGHGGVRTHLPSVTGRGWGERAARHLAPAGGRGDVAVLLPLPGGAGAGGAGAAGGRALAVRPGVAGHPRQREPDEQSRLLGGRQQVRSDDHVGGGGRHRGGAVGLARRVRQPGVGRLPALRTRRDHGDRRRCGHLAGAADRGRAGHRRRAPAQHPCGALADRARTGLHRGRAVRAQRNRGRRPRPGRPPPPLPRQPWTPRDGHVRRYAAGGDRGLRDFLRTQPMTTNGMPMGQSITRQARRAAVSAAAGLELPAACAPQSDDDDGSVAESGTVKVGFLSPVTGPVAAAGIEMREGWELYWQEHGETVGEITVETIFEDDAGNPDTALTKAKRLIEEEQVDVIVGPLLANTALAVADYVTRAGIPSLQPVTAADDLTQRKHHPLLLRAGSYTGSQMNFPGGQWAYEQGHRRAITLCPDYAFGWESCAGFVRAFTAAGGEIVDQLWFPLGTQDFSPYVTEMSGTDADIAFVVTAGGADGPTFLRAFHEFGLKDELPLLTNCCAMDQATLRDVGELAEGIHSVSYWAEGRDSPVVQEFVQAYKESYGKLP